MKNFFNNLTIGKKLTAGVASMLILVSSGVGIISYIQAFGAVQRQLEENAPQIAHYGSMLIKKQLDTNRIAMEGIAARAVIRSMDWKLQLPAITSEVERLRYFQIGIALPDGNTRLTDGSLTNIKERGYFKEAINGKSVVSDVIIHKVLKKPVQVVAVPIKTSDFRIVGIIFAVLDATWLCDLTDQIGYGKKGYSYVIDGKGTFIAYKDRDFVLKQTNFIEEAKTNPDFKKPAEMFERMIKGETGFDEYLFSGSVRIFGYTPIEGTGWSIAVGAYKSDVFQQVAAMRLRIIIISLVLFFIGVIIVAMLSRTITAPINQTVAMLKDLSEGEGDLTKRLEDTSGDEIGDMARYFNQFIEKLQRVITDIVFSAQNLSQSAEQIASGNQDLSRRTIEQASSLEEIAATIGQTTSAIIQNNNNSLEASRISGESSKVAIRGGGLVGEAVLSINEVNSSAKKIGEITGVINEIAFQTNLLALNAAVEAARAGEQGRGFAVVAGEVRNLAQRSGSAAKEISNLITDTVVKVENGTEKTYKSGESLKEIIESVKNVAKVISEIEESSNEQKQSMEEIASAISALDSLTQHNAALVEETSGASAEMLNQTHNLISLVSRFRIK